MNKGDLSMTRQRAPGFGLVLLPFAAILVAACASPKLEALHPATAQPPVHSPCQQGVKLDRACADTCVSTICAQHGACCDNSWTSDCVALVLSKCGKRCNCAELLQAGLPFDMWACTPCTTTVCARHSSCCTTAWDASCVAAAQSLCQL